MFKESKPTRWAIPLALLLIAATTTYYYFHGREYVYRFSESDLQQKLNAGLPVTKTYLLIFQVTLDNPRVSLKNGSDRVDAGIDVTLNIRVGGVPKPLGGSLDVSGGVKYLPESGEFFLTDPVIKRFAVQGIPEKYSEKVNTIMTKALADFYSERPVYTLTAMDAKQLAVRLVLKSVIVKNKELVVTLGI